MCKNIEVRQFTLKALIFRVLWPVVQVYNDTGRGNSVARSVEASLLSTVVTFARTIANGEFAGWPTTHQPVSTNCIYRLLNPEENSTYYIHIVST